MSPDHPVMEIHLSGVVTSDDYADVLVPAIEKALQDREQLRVLVRVGEGFERYTLEAMGADARLGLKHWNGFDRIAVVSDTGWLNTTVRAVSIFVNCPVSVFALGEEDAARRWLVESLGSIHQTDLGDGVLHVQLLGQIDSAVYAAESEDLNAFIRANERFRLLLDLREFDGWQGLGAIGAHFKLVRDHRHLVDRVAIVGDKAWQAIGQRIGRQFIDAPVHYFPANDFDGAKAWLLA
ncbi:STAS/SEC14 domain-containing protein [Tropicimonas sp. IMCC6043]|nr:STAS/SEC14 domain-containing protein [Tropicimonas sp. IMCC6043]